MEIVAVLIGVVVLTALNKWSENRLVRRIQKNMDKVMGRDD
jgi:hypothetical protein